MSQLAAAFDVGDGDANRMSAERQSPRPLALAPLPAAVARQAAFQRVGLFGHPAPIAREFLEGVAYAFVGGKRRPALAIFGFPQEPARAFDHGGTRGTIAGVRAMGSGGDG